MVWLYVYNNVSVKGIAKFTGLYKIKQQKQKQQQKNHYKN